MALDEQFIKERLKLFLEREAGAEIHIRAFKRFPVGFSWITIGAEIDGGGLPHRSLILKLGPDNGLYAPYSAKPQYEVLKALESSGVPVPRVYWHSDDRAAFGLPFFICERVVGNAPMPASTSTDDIVEVHRPELARQFVTAMANLHRLDWQKTRLAEWQPDTTTQNAALVQVEWCAAEYRRWASEPIPAIVLALQWLRRHAPPAPRLSLLHGDFRIGNFLAVDDRIAAILDWESAHIGDPHEDVAWAGLPQFGGGSGMVCRLLPPQDFIDAYERVAGWTVNRASLDYYTVLSLLKLALINLVSARRFDEPGKKDIRMAALGTQLPSSLRQMQKKIEATR